MMSSEIQPRANGPTGQPAVNSGHVLVVEDQQYDRELLVRVLGSDGHLVTTATSGTQGLSLLEQIRPDVVLCDVVMPGLNGLEFCSAVKARSRTDFVPVLLVTGKTDREDILAGFEAGADDYIAKPIEARELKARVRTMVRISQLQQQLVTQSRKLDEARQDMEAFLHAVSHDLRAPMISLSGLAAMLDRDHGAALSATGQGLLEKLQDSVGSMSALVNHLVEFARMGTAPHRPRPIHLRILVDQACTNLAAQIDQGRVHLEIQPDWPTLSVDPVSLCQVFQNLLANAIKFMGPQRAPKIAVRCRELPARWEISVEDNGIGIPPDKHERIFRLFERLGQVATDGLGVGLSTADKIVRRHGGQIGVESTVGEGATFRFTIPKSQG